MAIYAWSRGTRTARLFALFALAGVVWAWGYSLSLASVSLPAKLFWTQVEQVGVVLAPVAWAAFAFQYTGREKWLSPLSGALVVLLPALTLAVVASNDSFGLMWRAVALSSGGPFVGLRLTPGSWYIVHLAYTYALYLVGSFIILLSSIRAPQLYRQQSRTLLLSMFMPWAGSMVDVLGWTRLPNWEVAPISFALSAVVMAWGIYRYQLLDLMPVARDTLVDASGDGLVVLDAHNRIVDINPAARQILLLRDDRAVGLPANKVITFRPDLFGPAPGTPLRAERFEVVLGPAGQRRDYDLSVSLISDERGRVNGRLIALRDITEHKRIEGELRAQRQLFADLVAVARATSGGPTLQATLQNALNVAATLTAAERGSLFLLNPQAEVTHSLLTYGGITPDEQQGIVRRVMDRGLAGWVVRKQQAVLIRDTAHDERWLASAAEVHPVGSALGVPILSGGALVGVLTLTHSQAQRFTDEHLNLMQAAADQLALALRNAQIFESQRDMAQRQATLYGVLRAVGEQLSPQAVARAAVEAISQLVSGQAWPSVSLALPERDGQAWVNSAGYGRLAAAVGLRLPMTHGIVGRAFRTGQPQYVPDVAADPDYIVGNAAINSELAVPMRRGERVLGVLNLESEQPNAFTPDDVLLAESLADAVALSLDNANLYQTNVDERGRLQALIASSRDGLFMISIERRFLVVNAAGLQLLGLPGEPQDWLGWPLQEILPPLRRKSPAMARAMLAEMRRLARGDEPPAEGEVDLGGPPRVLHWLSLPVLAGEVPLGRLLVLRDVTQERLVQKLREELTDTLVHDLRNPLTNIRMALEMLDQLSTGLATQQQLGIQRVARSSTERMLGLVNAILDVSRLESGQMPVNREPVALRPLADEVIGRQQPLAQEKHLLLENCVPPGLPLVSADPALITRVLENLLGNALKFTPEGGWVRLSAAADSPDGCVVVTVRDNGPGLSPELRGTLFQKFMTGRHGERGSGLGLAFCKLAVEAHGGRIWVESEPGAGAVFCFSLPPANGAVEDEWDVVE